MRQVSIRRFTARGSETSIYVIEEAERVVAKALEKSLVIDEDKNEVIKAIMPDTQRILIVNPIAGG